MVGKRIGKIVRRKYIIGSAAIIVFIIIAILSFDSSRIEYTDFASAKSKGKIVQVIGKYLPDKPAEFNASTHTFTFHMRDEKGVTSLIEYKGAKPANFETAPSIVVKGRFAGDVFEASHILTKCPSKYEGKDIELHKGKK